MSAQLIELLLFAGVAFILINRLVAMIGTTDEDDPARKNSFFGEPKGMKDVTNIQEEYEEPEAKLLKEVKSVNAEEHIVTENKANILEALEEIYHLIPKFNVEKFIKSAKLVFKMVIEALRNNDQNSINQLVDKRYIDKIPETLARYSAFKDLTNVEAKISEVLTFGNSVIIKILFKAKNFQEEWTFQKSLLNSSPDWYVTNTDPV